MMFDDDDDMPLPDQFLSQLDLIESQAMANMELPCSKTNENISSQNAPVFVEVENLKNTIEDYKRQIERLQDREMSLQGEATMLRQRLDAKQKEADAARMEMHKSVDQLNQTHKRKLEDLEQQVRSFKSQLQFADHELQQSRSARLSLNGSLLSSQRQQPNPSKQVGIVQYSTAVEKSNPVASTTRNQSSPVPEVEAFIPIKLETIQLQQQQQQYIALPEDTLDQKWFLPSRRLSQNYTHHYAFGMCCGVNKTAAVSCPVSTKRAFVCDLLSIPSASSFVRVLEHVKLMVQQQPNHVISKTCIESVISLFDLIGKFFSLNDQSNNVQESIVVTRDDHFSSIAVQMEHVCSLLEDANFLKYILTSLDLHCAALRLVSSMFLKLPVSKASFSSLECANETNKRFQEILRRTFERSIPGLLTNLACDQGSKIAQPLCESSSSVNEFSPLFEAVLLVLSSASCHFNVIDLRSYMADCPLLTVSSAFLNWFNAFSFPLNARISSKHRNTCFTYIQLIKRSVTLTSGSLERFFNHPCQCQPMVIAILAHIGLASMRTDQQAGENLADKRTFLLNSLIIDGVLNALLLIESQQPLKAANHQPVFHLFLAKLAEFICRYEDYKSNSLRDSTICVIHQLLRLHDVLPS